VWEWWGRSLGAATSYPDIFRLFFGADLADSSTKNGMSFLVPEVWRELRWKKPWKKNTTSGGFESPFGGNSTSKN